MRPQGFDWRLDWGSERARLKSLQEFDWGLDWGFDWARPMPPRARLPAPVDTPEVSRRWVTRCNEGIVTHGGDGGDGIGSDRRSKKIVRNDIGIVIERGYLMAVGLFAQTGVQIAQVLVRTQPRRSGSGGGRRR